MDKEEVKINQEEVQTPSKKDSFNSRFASRFPEVNSEDEEAYYGTLNNEFDRIEKSDEAQKKLGEALAKDPRNAGFLMVMMNGGNPVEYLLEQYGEDFKEALDDEEKAKEFADAVSKNLEKRAENDKLKAQATENMQKMVDALDAAQADGSFSDDEAVKAFEYLYADGGLLDRIIVNDITKEDWMMLMKAAKYDDMVKENETKVAVAREEGEIAGRNANIDIQKKKKSAVKAMPSNVPSNGSVKPAPKKDGFLAMLDEKTKSVWD